MEDTNQRILIADSCGLKTNYFRFWHLSHSGEKWWDAFADLSKAESTWKHFGFPNKPVESYTEIRFLPNYLNDLNACNELIDWLNERGWSCVLVAENNARCCTFIKGDVEYKVIKTTFPRAICESFLRVAGKWVD